MSRGYEEILEGATVLRPSPGTRHEEICERLHASITTCGGTNGAARLLPVREAVRLFPDTEVRPDLALVTAATGKLWLAAEIINTEDHKWDTVVKKQLYEQVNIPRLWMIDPRYDNVEIYHGSQYGLALKAMLAGRDFLTEMLLPELKLSIADLFGLKPKEPTSAD